MTSLADLEGRLTPDDHVVIVAGELSAVELAGALPVFGVITGLVVRGRPATWQVCREVGLPRMGPASDHTPGSAIPPCHVGLARDLRHWEGGGGLAVADSLGLAKTIAGRGSTGQVAARAAKAASHHRLVLASTYADHEVLYELVVALDCDPQCVTWVRLQRPPRRWDRLETPFDPDSGKPMPGAAPVVTAVSRALSLLVGGEQVMILGATPTLTGEYGCVPAAITALRPATRIGWIDRWSSEAEIEDAMSAELILGDLTCVGLAAGASTHVIVIGSPFPSPAGDLRCLLGVGARAGSVAFALSGGGGGATELTAAESAALHGKARFATRHWAGRVAPSDLARLATGRGRLRESLTASALRGHRVGALIPQILRSEGHHVCDSSVAASPSVIECARHLAQAREVGPRRRAQDIVDATKMPVGLNLFCSDKASRRAGERALIAHDYPHLAYDRSTGRFNPALADDPDLCPDLVLVHHARGSTVPAMLFATIDLLLRGDADIVTRVAEAELRDDALAADYYVTRATLTLDLLRSLTRADHDPAGPGLHAWLASRRWNSGDTVLCDRMAAADVWEKKKEVGLFLRATWAPGVRVAQVVGDILQRLAITTCCVQGTDRTRTYRAMEVSLANAEVLARGFAERLREDEAAEQLLSQHGRVATRAAARPRGGALVVLTPAPVDRERIERAAFERRLAHPGEPPKPVTIVAGGKRLDVWDRMCLGPLPDELGWVPLDPVRAWRISPDACGGPPRVESPEVAEAFAAGPGG